MDTTIDLASWILIGVGSLFAVGGGIGIVRMPDLFTRMHAASLTDTMGAGLILTALLLQEGLTLTAVKLVSILAFLTITSPTSAHALARAALAAGVKPTVLGPRKDRA